MKKESKTVFYVEDEIALAKMMKQIIEAEGHKVIMAHEGNEAIKQFRAKINEIDIVLTDRDMPNGYKWHLEAIKSGKPIILTSGRPLRDIQEYQGVKIKYFLEKPTMPEGYDALMAILKN